MGVVDVLKLLGGIGGALGVIGVGIMGLSKFRNSKLRTTFEQIANTVTEDKGQVHELEISVAKDEQSSKTVDQKIEAVDQQIEKVDQEKPKDATNGNIIDMFDKLSKS